MSCHHRSVVSSKVLGTYFVCVVVQKVSHTPDYVRERLAANSKSCTADVEAARRFHPEEKVKKVDACNARGLRLAVRIQHCHHDNRHAKVRPK